MPFTDHVVRMLRKLRCFNSLVLLGYTVRKAIGIVPMILKLFQFPSSCSNIDISHLSVLFHDIIWLTRLRLFHHLVVI